MPTRFGNVSAQLKQFIEQAGTLWQRRVLVHKVATAFTSSQTSRGEKSTMLALNNTFYHSRMLIPSLGYTDDEVFAASGNSDGTSFTADHVVTGPHQQALAVARYQGHRLASYAAVGDGRRREASPVKRPPAQSFPTGR
jgi:NAD(P)H dehydrogenase (quinone)